MPSPPEPDDIISRAGRMRRATVERMRALVSRYALHSRLFLAKEKSGELTPDAALLLADLAAFAFADRPSRPSDALPLERIEGRRDVYFRLTRALALDGAKLAQMRLKLEAGDE